ncbi:tetratricopeptide repeat protein [Dyadobacter sandarakinus]|uniref:Tetratricopeptide repeat protein n=2 Tax=Dyadobacter sandarakinus TaxID=2747268 RepID=A0ABX7ID24_9BACT|nr:tetratricopeptide repeat protein [Dyadobacter sandarakinus]
MARLSCLLLSALLWTILLSSCQSDARNATRIPPVVKKTRAQWQDDAMASLTDLIGRGIDTDINYFKRARIYFEREQYTKALDDINKSIYEQNNSSEYFLLRGKVYREMGRMGNALEDAQRAEALQQRSPDLYVLLADIYQAQGHFGEAAGYLSQALKMAPYDGGAYYVKGILQARQGDTLASLSSFDYATSVNPRLLRAYEQSIAILLKLNDPGKALEVNSRAIRRFPKSATLHFERGQIFQSMALPDTALYSYEMAVSIRPNYEEALIRVADLGIQLRRFPRALAAIHPLLRMKPASKEVNNMAGFCYEKTGEYEQAKEYYTTALGLSPGDQDARYGLFRIRQRQNEAMDAAYGTVDDGDDRFKLLDTARVKITTIQPRGTTNIRIDSSRKAKIE